MVSRTAALLTEGVSMPKHLQELKALTSDRDCYSVDLNLC